MGVEMELEKVTINLGEGFNLVVPRGVSVNSIHVNFSKKSLGICEFDGTLVYNGEEVKS